MPTDKDFKRLVRARMQKTGEAYTAARARLLQKQQRSSSTGPASAAEPRPDYAALAGMSDPTIKARTGRTWEGWVETLDGARAHEWTHTAIARHVHERYGVPGWWTQAVTVGYERIKGLRAIGQRRGGQYEASKSRTFPVSVTRLYRAFGEARTRRRWLPGVRLTVRTSTRDKSMRITWDDGTAVDLYFVGKGAAKSQVAVQHRKLTDRAAADRMKTYWTERLGALAELLAAARK
jgi:uncharacterized protein YndB with AHSA1/START domain